MQQLSGILDGFGGRVPSPEEAWGEGGETGGVTERSHVLRPLGHIHPSPSLPCTPQAPLTGSWCPQDGERPRSPVWWGQGVLPSQIQRERRKGLWDAECRNSGAERRQLTPAHRNCHGPVQILPSSLSLSRGGGLPKGRLGGWPAGPALGPRGLGDVVRSCSASGWGSWRNWAAPKPWAWP